MATAADICRDDVVSFDPDPRFRSALKRVSQLQVHDILRDDKITVVTFIIDSIRTQVLLPNDHPDVIVWPSRPHETE